MNAKKNRLIALIDGPPSKELCEKLQMALREYFLSYPADQKGYLTALGIAPDGGFRPGQCYRLAQRDRLLSTIARYTPPGVKPHVYLAGEIHVFEDRIWPRWKTLEKPPENAGEVRSILFMARKLTPKKPLPGIRQVENILKSK